MIIARQKKKENIAEYVLYMWQIEDLIRAFGFDLEKIQQGIINNFSQPDEVKTEMREWYSNLIRMMKEEGIAEKGHLQVIKNVVDDMNSLHLELLRKPDQIKYNTLYYSTIPCLADLRQKSNAGTEVNDVELSLNALYGILMLKLQHKEISEGTQQAITQISKFLAVLSEKYKEDSEA